MSIFLRSLTSLCICMLFFLVSPAYAGNSTKPQPKNHELQTITLLIENLKTDLSRDRSIKSNLNKELEKTQSRLTHVSSSLKNTNSDLLKKKAAASSLQSELRNFQKNLSAQQKMLAEQLKTSFYLSRYSYIDTLLSQKDPAEIQRALTFHKYVVKARMGFIDELSDNIKSVQSNKLKMLHKARTLQAILKSEENEKHKLLTTKEVHKKQLGQVNKTIQSKNQKLSQLIIDKHHLEQIIKNLQLAGAVNFPTGVTPFASLQGKLPWPTKGHIQERFGTDVAHSGMKSTGVLIAAPVGQPVRSLYKGKVVFANWIQGFGHMIIVEHGSGYMTLYGSNKELLKKQGDMVNPGDIIAKVGQSSIPTQTGLYFEIRRNGTPINPELWCHGVAKA